MANSLEIQTFDELRKSRVIAISNWNGLDYKQICDTLGLEPEIPELYALGEAEKIYWDNKGSDYEDSKMREFERNKLKTPPRKEQSQARYEKFYTLWANSRINENSFGLDSKAKRKALLIFPKFQKTGVQNIEQLNDLQVGKLYKTMLDYSMERIDRI
ncbi:MAG: hypothetical protein PHQ66_01570 [Candidatus Nanoarchaeia archaeon]|nr:hypothetical protein [Candidatus Nanoarchaeia archaeon]MDD5357935.1 hypothetical protein [Candidatus Nanoarchaeia archaeon]MDD5588854.1 hypothetical protein [Candidatus Nanoarchaeia archaeon]